MTKINPEIFRAYDIRGRFPDELDEYAAYASARAFVRYLVRDLKQSLPLKIAVGQDMRVHSPFIAREVLRGLADEGVDVVDIGEVSTPALYYAVAFNDYAGGVMVTASHMTKEFNGLKLCAAKAVPIAKGSGIEKIKEYALGLNDEKPSGKGSVSSVENVTDHYVQQDLSYVGLGKLKKLRIVADTANCMGATYLESMFHKIPVELIKLNWELNGNMPIHEANPSKPETLQQLREVIRNEQADMGIATDGDGDRIVFLDERAEVIPDSAVTEMVGKQLAKRNQEANTAFMEDYNPEEFEKFLFIGLEGGRYFFRENYYFCSPVFTILQLFLLKNESENPMIKFSELISV